MSNMTQREKIREQARKLYPNTATHPMESASFCGFTAGGAYGYNLAMEKAVEWLCMNMTDTLYFGCTTKMTMSKPELINNLKNAIKL